ncbi:MAG: hypothetical protein HFJ59_03200 [Clostridia bacterium]|nr:hypothetical protein [Clostridia bacterium]
MINNEVFMLENQKNKRGITLIALIITIIILLILAGISIVQLTGSGIFGKAEIANQKTRYETAKEIVNLKLIEIELDCTEKNEKYNIVKIAEGMKEAKDITIEKYYNKEEAAIKEDITKNITNLEGIVVSVNKYSEYKFLIGEECKIKGVLEKEVTNTTSKEDFIDIKEFEENFFNGTNTKVNKFYLYNYGDKCIETTGGWDVDRQSNTAVDIDSYDYMDVDSTPVPYCALGISTNNYIDISAYKKLKMKVTVQSNGYNGTVDGYILGVDKSKISTNKWYSLDYSTEKSQILGEEMIVELDLSTISNEDKRFYIGIQEGSFHLKVYQIWLE